MKKVHDIKRAQKASLLLRTISTLFAAAVRDDAQLNGVMINRVELAPDKSTCYVYFYTAEGEESFNQKLLSRLILYKPSLRAALAKEIASRYTPELVFKFDNVFEKSLRIETLLSELKEKGEL